MANFTGAQVYHGNTDTVETTQRHPLGTVAKDSDGNEYIYLDYNEAVVAGEWVTWNYSYAATGIAATTRGPVGVAMAAASTSDLYGWAQIKGVNTAALCTSSVTTADCLITAAASTDISCPTVGATTTFSDLTIIGATAMTAASTATTTVIPASCTVYLDHPKVLGAASS